MGQYIKYYNNFDSSKFKMRWNIDWEKWCYIHLSILKWTLEWVISNWYEVLWWEAIIYTPEWTLSPVELVIWTWPETDKESRNKNALYRDYKYFIYTIDKRSKDWEYRKEDVFIDLVFNEI